MYHVIFLLRQRRQIVSESGNLAAVGIIRDNKTLDTIINLFIILVTLRRRNSVEVGISGFTDSYSLKVSFNVNVMNEVLSDQILIR